MRLKLTTSQALKLFDIVSHVYHEKRAVAGYSNQTIKDVLNEILDDNDPRKTGEVSR